MGVHSLNKYLSKENLLKSFGDSFKELVNFLKSTTTFNGTVTPIKFFSPRKVLFVLRDKVKTEILRVEQLRFIAREINPTVGYTVY